MKTGLTKKQKVTELWFTEAETAICVRTHNTQLKNRLLDFSRTNPECCRLTDDDGMGGLEFEVDRSSLSIRLTKPYTDDRRKAASTQAKEMYVSKGRLRKCKGRDCVQVRSRSLSFTQENILSQKSLLAAGMAAGKRGDCVSVSPHRLMLLSIILLQRKERQNWHAESPPFTPNPSLPHSTD